MGWDYDTKPAGMSVLDFMASTFSNDVIAGEVVGSTVYLAVRSTKTGHVGAVVCPFMLAEQGDTNIAWKAMREEVEPFSYDCPAAILDVLSPTDNEGALTWRAKCRRKLAGEDVSPSLGRVFW